MFLLTVHFLSLNLDDTLKNNIIETPCTFHMNYYYTENFFQDKVNSVVYGEGFFGHIPPIPGAIEAVKEMAELEK